jgi:hypothetical protein
MKEKLIRSPRDLQWLKYPIYIWRYRQEGTYTLDFEDDEPTFGPGVERLEIRTGAGELLYRLDCGFDPLTHKGDRLRRDRGFYLSRITGHAGDICWMAQEKRPVRCIDNTEMCVMAYYNSNAEKLRCSADGRNAELPKGLKCDLKELPRYTHWMGSPRRDFRLRWLAATGELERMLLKEPQS